MELRVYCSGSIIKGQSDHKKLCWTDTERDQIRLGAQPAVIKFLNPDDAVCDLNNDRALFGRDMFQIQICDAVVIDARERRGIGIGVELLAARHFSKPVVGVLPPSTYYRQGKIEYRGGVAENYVHPHFSSLLSAITDDFTDAGNWLKNNLPLAKGASSSDVVLEEAIAAYKATLLPSDWPMRELLSI